MDSWFVSLSLFTWSFDHGCRVCSIPSAGKRSDEIGLFTWYIYIYIYIYIHTHYGSYTSTSKCWWVVTPNLDQRIKYAKLLVIIWLFDIAFATVHVWIAQNALSMCLRFTLCGFIDTVYETHHLKKKYKSNFKTRFNNIIHIFKKLFYYNIFNIQFLAISDI